MKILNSINWSTIKLYHGTNDEYLRSIFKNGFFIPIHDGNWLGRGTYFAVNNIFLPILFSNSHAKKHGGHPVIIEINAKYLADDIKNTILDLTTQQGLNVFHNICNDFINFIKPYDRYPELKDELKLLEKHFAASPFYDEKLKPNLIPNLDWFVLAIGVKKITDNLEIDKDERIDGLRIKGSENITNLIFDWFNFKYSCGMEVEVPIRGVMASYNSGQGTPIALANILKDHKINRSFADYISYLNRAELSIFGYDYYRCKEQFWDFKRLFSEEPQENTHFKKYIGQGPIINLLKKSFNESEALGFKMDAKAIEDLYELLISEYDTN